MQATSFTLSRREQALWGPTFGLHWLADCIQLCVDTAQCVAAYWIQLCVEMAQCVAAYCKGAAIVWLHPYTVCPCSVVLGMDVSGCVLFAVEYM
jgi:hypothetical protein